MQGDIRYYPVNGKNTDDWWAQSISTRSGFVFVEIHAPYGQARERGVRVLEQVTQFLEEYADNRRLLLEKLSRLQERDIKSLGIVEHLDGTVAVSLFGEGAIYLCRKTLVSRLLNSGGSKTGQVKEGDVFIGLTASAYGRIAENLISLIQGDVLPEELAQSVSVILSDATEETCTGAGMISHLIVLSEQSAVQHQGRKSLSVFQNSNRILSKEFFAQQVRGTPQRIRTFWFGPMARRHRSLVLAIVAVVLFFVSVVLGIVRQKNNTYLTKLTNAYMQAEEKLNTGVALLDIDKGKSQVAFKEAESLLAPFPVEKLPNSKLGRDITELKQKIVDNEAIAINQFSRALTLYYDASFVQKDRVISMGALSDDTFAFIDTSAGKVGRLAVAGKNAEILDGGDIYKSAKSLTVQGDTIFILTNDGVVKIDKGTPGHSPVLATDEVGGNAREIASYGTNLYIFSPADDTIARFIPNDKDTGYKKEDYFSGESHPDLSHASGLLIDGSIWLGGSLGNILRFSAGGEDPFVPRGVPTTLGNTLSVATNENLADVFVLDVEHKRIAQFTKTGVYKAQYTWSDDVSPTTLYVSSTGKRLFLLADKKLYSIEVQ